jgi:uncharacterized protein
MGLRFEWDQRKAALNLKKHGVSFQEATSIFADTLSITGARRASRSEQKEYENKAD